MIATDTEGKIVLINHAAEQLTGWKQSECFGVPLNSVFNIIDITSVSLVRILSESIAKQEDGRVDKPNNPYLKRRAGKALKTVAPLSKIRWIDYRNRTGLS